MPPKYLIPLIFLAGCATTNVVHVPLEPRPNHVQVTEVRPSWFSTHVVGVVYDGEGRIAGVTGSGGRAIVTVPLSILGAGATLGGAYILGNSIFRAGEAIGEASVDVTHEFVVPEKLPAVPPGFLPPGLGGEIPPGLAK